MNRELMILLGYQKKFHFHPQMYFQVLVLLIVHCFAATGSSKFFEDPAWIESIRSIINHRQERTEIPMSLSSSMPIVLNLLHKVENDELMLVPNDIWPALSGNQLIYLAQQNLALFDWAAIANYHFFFIAYSSTSRLTRQQLNLLLNNYALNGKDQKKIRYLLKYYQSLTTPPKPVTATRRALNFDNIQNNHFIRDYIPNMANRVE